MLRMSASMGIIVPSDVGKGTGAGTGTGYSFVDMQSKKGGTAGLGIKGKPLYPDE
jgi:hypothetical protein